MCLLCISIAKGKITSTEARRNMSEMQLTEEHRKQVEEAIDDLAIEEMADWFAKQGENDDY